MTDLTDVNIKELLGKSDAELRASLEAMLPKPAYPENLLGRWAKHPEYGDVVCIWDKPDFAGGVFVRWRAEYETVGSRGDVVPVSELTFPEQTTRPEDVPVGEAWLVNVDDGARSAKRVVALRANGEYWRTGAGVVGGEPWWLDEEVTLIAPLVPARPEPEPEPEHPRTLSSLEDYENAPLGTIVASSDNNPWVKTFDNGWGTSWTGKSRRNSGMAELEEQVVLREGWGSLE